MRLQQSPGLAWQDVPCRDAGAYLITYDDRSCYIGEAKDLRRRVGQQFRSRSTFYKSYREGRDSELPTGLRLHDFRVRYINLSIGRKELEEYGIEKLKLRLNKASGRADQPHTGRLPRLLPMAWEDVQANALVLISQGEQQVLAATWQEWLHARVPSGPGTYLVHDKEERLIYIGETSHLPRRYLNHSKGTRASALRRHIGTELLGLGFSKPITFTKPVDQLVNRHIESCTLAPILVLFGRRELEEHLIRSHRPLLNRKDNKGRPPI